MYGGSVFVSMVEVRCMYGGSVFVSMVEGRCMYGGSVFVSMVEGWCMYGGSVFVSMVEVRCSCGGQPVRGVSADIKLLTLGQCTVIGGRVENDKKNSVLYGGCN